MIDSSSSLPLPGVDRPTEEHDDPEVAVDRTSEVRWFFEGQPPKNVLSWFNGGGGGLVEERRDTYRLDGQVDIGVKRRYGATLELKLRLQPPVPFVASHDLDGRLELWQRWSPADGRIYLNDQMIWVDVDKTVIKRRFGRDGHEVPLTHETRAMDGQGCDAEIAIVSVEGQTAWTFAFAAFGAPLDDHHDLLRAAWGTLIGDVPRPNRLQLSPERSHGYPEWMARFFSLPLTPAERSR